MSLIAEFFLHNPDKTFVDALTRLVPEGFTDNASIQQAVRNIASCAADAAHDDEALLNLKRNWTKLFRGISPDYGPTAPYAFLFLKGNSVEMMSDLAALYIDGGYDGYQKIRDRIDYIGICFQFLAVVDLQIANSINVRDALEYKRLKLCRKVFLEEYLTAWVFEFILRARKFVQTPFYGAVLDLTMHCLELFAGEHKTFPVLMSEEESRELATREDNEMRRMLAAMERGDEMPHAHA